MREEKEMGERKKSAKRRNKKTTGRIRGQGKREKGRGRGWVGDM